jgi:hypothetical protein
MSGSTAAVAADIVAPATAITVVMSSAKRPALDRWLVRIALPSASRTTCPEVLPRTSTRRRNSSTQDFAKVSVDGSLSQ